MKIVISDREYDEEFVKKVQEISGENFHKCMQCGTCSGSCPMLEEMQISPRQLVALAHFGLSDLLLKADTVWLCASCHTCEARCPRGLDLPKLMEAIRQVALRKNVDHVEILTIPKSTMEELPQIALVSAFRKHTS
jgi:heterodisulfide reductase subunit C